MMRQARKVIVVAESSKMGQTSSALICPVSAIHPLATDHAISAEMMEQLSQSAREVVRA